MQQSMPVQFLPHWSHDLMTQPEQIPWSLCGSALVCPGQRSTAGEAQAASIARWHLPGENIKFGWTSHVVRPAQVPQPSRTHPALPPWCGTPWS